MSCIIIKQFTTVFNNNLYSSSISIYLILQCNHINHNIRKYINQYLKFLFKFNKILTLALFLYILIGLFESTNHNLINQLQKQFINIIIYKHKRINTSNAPLEVQSNSLSTSRGGYPPEVTTSRSPAESSSNYLSLKSKATPGDRGGEGSDGSSIMGMMEDGAKDVLDVTSSGEPESDLRELEGELNKGGCLQDKERTSGGTPSGRKCVNPEEQELPGRTKSVAPKNRNSTRNNRRNLPGGTKVVNPEERETTDVTSGGLPENDLRDFEGEVNREAVCKTTSGGRADGRNVTPGGKKSMTVTSGGNVDNIGNDVIMSNDGNNSTMTIPEIDSCGMDDDIIGGIDDMGTSMILDNGNEMELFIISGIVYSYKNMSNIDFMKVLISFIKLYRDNGGILDVVLLNSRIKYIIESTNLDPIPLYELLNNVGINLLNIIDPKYDDNIDLQLYQFNRTLNTIKRKSPHIKFIQNTTKNTISSGLRFNKKIKSSHSNPSEINSTLPNTSSLHPPLEVTTSLPLAVEASSNYLSLKSKATPRDRGGSIVIGPRVEPAADLREAEGQLNKGADGRTNGTAKNVTSFGRDVSMGIVGVSNKLIDESSLEISPIVVKNRNNINSFPPSVGIKYSIKPKVLHIDDINDEDLTDILEFEPFAYD